MIGEDSDPGGTVRFTWGEGNGSLMDFPLGAEGDPFITRSGQIFGYYEIMNGRGDVDSLADSDTADFASKGIPYFLSILNSFANTFATTFNELNSGGVREVDGMWESGPPLFTTHDGDDVGINIFNITISNEWQDDPRVIARSMTESDMPGASRNENILRMIDALRREDTLFDMGAEGGTGEMRASFQQFISMLNSEIAIEIDYNARRLSMSDVLLLSIDNMRESIKGVSEDEEASNLMRFQRSYQAAARLMTTLDEMLELIIMRMGIVGR